MNSTVKFILLTQGDPWGEARGGQTAFARCLLTVFGPEIAVACHSGGDEAEGCWTTREWRGRQVHFFNLGSLRRSDSKRSWLPMRVKSWWRTRRHLAAVRAFGGRCLVDNPEQMIPAAAYRWDSFVYLFSGINNPVSNSRYAYLRWLGPWGERLMVRTLLRMKPARYLAAASRSSIAEFAERTGHAIPAQEIVSFPSRADHEVFFPCKDRDGLRAELGVTGSPLLVATGRLCWVKGWDLLLTAVEELRRSHPAVQLVFVGDGEDRAKLTAAVARSGMESHVTITGFVGRTTVAKYLNAADLCLVGSHREGWSVAMCEALACGCPLVSSAVSGAAEMIEDGKNGFVVANRDPHEFARKIAAALQLQSASEYALEKSRNYITATLREDLLSLWPDIR